MIEIVPTLLFCILLSVGRCWYTGRLDYLFLNWNLFLAAIPLLFSFVMQHRRWRHSKAMLVFGLCAWLLFFPNAPYIVTDLLHLRDRIRSPLLSFDLILLFSYAWLGLVIGFRSALHIERLLAEQISARIAALCLYLLMFVSAFGVYLGRYLRWNSWDLFQKPLPIIADITEHVADPLAHADAWVMTLLFGCMLSVFYFWYKKSITTTLF